MSIYERYPGLTSVSEEINQALEIIINTYESGGKLLACGNGGSCADCDHIVGELMKSFMFKRKTDSDFTAELIKIDEISGPDIVSKLEGALPAISLPAQAAVISAFANDVDAELVYAQLVYGYGQKGDILICLSTSGNSKNVVQAAKVAKAKGLKTVAMTGSKESALSEICDITIRVPETETYKIQELHLPVYHYLCAETEKHFFK